MLIHRKCLSVLFAGCITLLSLPLRAQLNPKWQTSTSPDFLNLYQQSNSKAVKPEVVTVFDFSASMQCIVYHKNYAPPASDDYSGTDPQIRFQRGSITITTPSPSVTYYYPYATLTIGGAIRTSYTFVRPDGAVLIGNFGATPRPDVAPTNISSDKTTLSNARTLIRATNNTITNPWGTFTLPSAFNGPGNQEQDVRNWVRAASHVRFRVNSRNIDIPINWTILDTTSTGYPLSPAYGMDNAPSTPVKYPLDITYTIGYGGFSANSSTDVSIPRDANSNCRQSMRYRTAYMNWVFAGTNIPTADGTDSKPAFLNGLPNVNRVQSVKSAAIRAWLANQADILFAYRFLCNSDSNGESNRSVINSNSRGNPWNSYNAYFSTAPWSATDPYWDEAGMERTWTVMNQNTSTGIRRLAATCSTASTPLTLALANTYAQMNDTNNIFSDVEVDRNTVPEGDPNWLPALDFRAKECSRRFVLLFTDGNPNSEPTTTDNSPYETGGVGNARDGNAVIIQDPSQVNPVSGRPYWSIPNLAAMAAHLNDSTRQLPGDTVAHYMDPPASYPANNVTTKTVSDFLPFAVKNRGSVTFAGEFAAIQTMTFGVSLGGTLTTGSKGRLFKAAVMGDPRETSWNIGTKQAFKQLANGEKDPNSVYFFDASDAASMETGLNAAFRATTGISNTNSTSAPVLPTMGTGLGAAVYLSKFQPPESGGPIWNGDLMMYPIMETSSGVSQLVDSSGNPLIGSNLAAVSNAQWAASLILSDAKRTWYNRVIYTRVPSTSGTIHPPMLRVTIGGSNTYLTVSDSGYSTIKSLLPGTSDEIKFDNWCHFVGANVGDTTHTPRLTRDTVMGDVVSSAPAVLGYSTLPSTVTSTTLTTAWAGHVNPKFNVIFVGTNQGFLHAFGEVSWFETVTVGSNTFRIQKGVADELWAFAPTDLLPFIDYYRNSGNPHRFGVDGSPSVYLLDLPAANAVRGNGVFDVDASTKERALVIFGLGKGGRSYYAIDVRDPANPVFAENNAVYGAGMGWSLCPDETDNYPAGRFIAPAMSSQNTAITSMGLSTSVPTLGRIVATSSYLAKDVVFVGGGFSIREIEAKLPAKPNPAPNTDTRLGRSVLALDAKGGNILSVWDLTSDSSVGPISSGVVPYTFFRGSGFHQRAYFADYYGGLWALGYTGTDTSNIRKDSSYLDEWSASPRPVYKQALPNGLISTMPVPFSVPAMPVRTSIPLVNPAAVGVAFVTGDRNNPLDASVTTWAKPTQHRLNVVFDRQDSNLLGLDSVGISNTQMANASTLSTAELDPSDSSFYLKNKFGYFVNFPAGSNFVPKGISSPLALNGRLFYSYFDPQTANPCTGGTGDTDTFRISNLMLPDATTSDAPDIDHSGRILVWSGVASPFAVRSLVTGLQAGMSGGSGTNNNPNSTQNLQIQNLGTGGSEAFPKPRVWRTVH